MSSINHYPTFNYSQPDAYRFSHDSVFLAREVFEKHRSEMNQKDYHILDLCAGCGIVGLDLLFHQLNEEKIFPGKMDFLEIQEIYRFHFDENVRTLQKTFPEQVLNLNWIQDNYATLRPFPKYDLIISNPPYFMKNSGSLSNNEFKNRCRFFLDAGWKEMITFMQSSLKEKGRVYFLVRDELKEIIEKENTWHIQFPFQIRGTWTATFVRPVSQ